MSAKAWAIKGPEGEIHIRTLADDEGLAWAEWGGGHYSANDAEADKREGYTCVPVEIRELPAQEQVRMLVSREGLREHIAKEDDPLTLAPVAAQPEANAAPRTQEPLLGVVPSVPPAECDGAAPIPVNSPWERVPQHASDPGYGPVPPESNVVTLHDKVCCGKYYACDHPNDDCVPRRNAQPEAQGLAEEWDDRALNTLAQATAYLIWDKKSPAEAVTRIFQSLVKVRDALRQAGERAS